MSNECVTGVHITSINLPKLISVRICVCLANVTERGRERKESSEKQLIFFKSSPPNPIHPHLSLITASIISSQHKQKTES